MREFLLSMGYLGFLPGAPGTYASAVTLGVFLLGAHLGAPWWLWAVLAALAGVGVILAWGSGAVGGGNRDPRWCVLDESAGALVAVVGHVGAPALTAVAGLLFFRVVDILKPPPVNRAERLPGGWGILADDLVAGVLANVCVWLVRLAVGRF